LWPDLLIPEPFRDLPDELNLTDELLDRHLRKGRGDRAAIFFENRKMTYREIAEDANRFGNSLLDAGIRPRDRIGIRMTNLPEAIIANFAILKIGAVPVPMSPLWSKKEIVYATHDAGLRAILVNRSLMGEVQKCEQDLSSIRAFIIVDDISPDGDGFKDRQYGFNELVVSGKKDLRPFRLKGNDIAILLYTSGTTGPPKGCAHTLHGTLILSRLVTKYIWDLKEGDVLAGSAPISFAAGFGTFALIPWTSPGAISLLQKFSPEALMENIARHRVTMLTGIPTAYRKLLEVDHFQDYDLRPLRLCTVGGDALGAETFDAWMDKTGLPIWENYASTELFNTQVSNRIGQEPKKGSIGLPIPGIKVKVLDESGNPCPPGKIGTLYVKGPTGIIYWNPNGHNGRLMSAQRAGVKGGWNIAGDAVYQDEEGYLFFVAREDDMIKSSGYRVSPKEIEDALNGHPSIKEAAVVGVPDRIMGQAVKAFLVVEEGVAVGNEFEEEIKEYCKRNMALYKTPRMFQFVSQLPKTPTGKIMKNKL